VSSANPGELLVGGFAGFTCFSLVVTFFVVGCLHHVGAILATGELHLLRDSRPFAPTWPGDTLPGPLWAFLFLRTQLDTCCEWLRVARGNGEDAPSLAFVLGSRWLSAPGSRQVFREGLRGQGAPGSASSVERAPEPLCRVSVNAS
jgi:hypothetical protein